MSKKTKHQRAIRWLDDYETCNDLINKKIAYDIRKLLKKHGGLVRIPDFLPDFVAEYALSLVQAINDEWRPTEARQDYSQNNISHHFSSVKDRHAPQLEPLIRLFSLISPEQFHAFSAAKYVATDHIEPHDDKAYTDVQLDNGNVITCSRDIAVIYYLTKDWDASMGGTLIDLVTGKEYVPQFNSIVAFQVPRFHEVTAVTTQRPRYSIFGWFLKPGKLYELFSGSEDNAPSSRKRRKVEKETKGKKKNLGSSSKETVAGATDARKSTDDDKLNKRKTQQRDTDTGHQAHECKLARRLLAKYNPSKSSS